MSDDLNGQEARCLQMTICPDHIGHPYHFIKGIRLWVVAQTSFGDRPVFNNRVAETHSPQLAQRAAFTYDIIVEAHTP